MVNQNLGNISQIFNMEDLKDNISQLDHIHFGEDKITATLKSKEIVLITANKEEILKFLQNTDDVVIL